MQQPQSSITEINPEVNTYPEDPLYTDEQYYSEDSSGNYSGGEDYGEVGGYADTETITEIAEQVVNEKFKEYNKKTGDITTFKNMTQDKVNIIEQRLKRLEDTIDKLQQAIIQKIGEFGENTTIIRRDLENLHNTTSKLMNPLIDNFKELEKLNKHHK